MLESEAMQWKVKREEVFEDLLQVNIRDLFEIARTNITEGTDTSTLCTYSSWIPDARI